MPSLENIGPGPLHDHTDAASTRGDFSLDNEQIGESQRRDGDPPEWDLGISDRYAELQEIAEGLREWARENGFNTSYALDKDWLPTYESTPRSSPRYSLLNRRLALSYTSLPQTAAEKQRVYERIAVTAVEIISITKIGLFLGAAVGGLPGALAGARIFFTEDLEARLEDIVYSQLETGDYSVAWAIDTFFGIQRTEITVPEIREEYHNSQSISLDQPSSESSSINRTISRARQFRGK